ncbi:MAG: hypothetical protein JWM64_2771 [Frankiales bacterium]|nr:hypothetical protein [Frankiales bacterium]
MTPPPLAAALAGAYLAAPWDRAGLAAAGREVTGLRRPWLTSLAEQVLELYRTPPRDRPRELAAVVGQLPSFPTGRRRPRALVHRAAPTAMVRNAWRLPHVDTVADLAALLELTVGELGWFADVKGLERTAGAEPLRHYRASVLRTPSGGLRVLEAPKPRLKALQRRLLAEALHLVPLHDAAHGFRPGRSVATHAAPHTGRDVVVRLDLEGFFASVTAGRVYGVWRTAGYPEPVAHALTGLCTTVLPRHVWAALPSDDDPAHWRLGRRLAAPHLPQGAPTSPVLANLAAWRLDVRLTALLDTWGGRYTRYADDLALSGSWRRGTPRLLAAVEEVVRDEGFRLNARKTAVLPRSGRQVLGGLVVNERPHVARRDVDRLRAVLHDAALHGPEAANREQHPSFEAHLRGRVSWVAQHDPGRGARLQRMLDAVAWDR